MSNSLFKKDMQIYRYINSRQCNKQLLIIIMSLKILFISKDLIKCILKFNSHNNLK